jgi:hypothetical protein
MHKTGQASHRSRSSAETEKKDFIPRVVVVKDEPVPLQHIFAETGSKSIAAEFVPVCPQPFVVKNDLVFGSVFEHPEEFIDVGIVALAAFLTRSVREYDNVFRHDILLSSEPDHRLSVSMISLAKYIGGPSGGQGNRPVLGFLGPFPAPLTAAAMAQELAPDWM